MIWSPFSRVGGLCYWSVWSGHDMSPHVHVGEGGSCSSSESLDCPVVGDLVSLINELLITRLTRLTYVYRFPALKKRVLISG